MTKERFEALVEHLGASFRTMPDELWQETLANASLEASAVVDGFEVYVGIRPKRKEEG